jgi:uncharacterized membrane protein YidH (DUF202 family)
MSAAPIEQRLVEALRRADDLEPSDDLWNRVVHSIEEDRTHRRRVLTSFAVATGAFAALVTTALAFRRHDHLGSYVEPLALEALEVIALTTIAALLGPAIRRFGRNVTHDLWPVSPHTARGIVRLLDVAYALVFAGYILITTRFEGDPRPLVPVVDHLADQLQHAAVRIGGMVLLIGVLHALTMAALPFVALVQNSTRRGRPLPRWMTWLLVAVLGVGLVQVVPLVVALIAGA